MADKNWVENMRKVNEERMKEAGVKTWKEYLEKTRGVVFTSKYLHSSNLINLAREKKAIFRMYDKSAFYKAFDVFVEELMTKIKGKPRLRRIQLINRAFGIEDEVKEEKTDKKEKLKAEVKEETKEEAAEEVAEETEETAE